MFTWHLYLNIEPLLLLSLSSFFPTCQSCFDFAAAKHAFSLQLFFFISMVPEEAIYEVPRFQSSSSHLDLLQPTFRPVSSFKTTFIR